MVTWIKKYLSEEDFKKIENTIAEVEEQTQGEIVPVIVRRSSAVAHVPVALTLVLTLLTVLVELPWKDVLWTELWIYFWPVLIVGYFIFSVFLGKIKWIQKIFVPEVDELSQVHQRAQLEFYANQVHRTQQGTGVLIFVSIMERKAVILADKTLMDKLPADAWDSTLEKFRHSLKKGQWGEGFVQAIRECAEPLKTHFPITSESSRELKNHLIVKD